MATLGETLSNKLINDDIDYLITSDRNYRFSNTKLGDDFANYDEFCKWYNKFCYDWYHTCKSIAKLLGV